LSWPDEFETKSAMCGSKPPRVPAVTPDCVVEPTTGTELPPSRQVAVASWHPMAACAAASLCRCGAYAVRTTSEPGFGLGRFGCGNGWGGATHALRPGRSRSAGAASGVYRRGFGQVAGVTRLAP
jgi:hypothetical protein